MILLAAFLDVEGWAQHASGFTRALGQYERTSLIDWKDVKRGSRSPLSRVWRRFFPGDAVGISLGAVERTPTLDSRYRIPFCVWETTRIPGPMLFHLLQAEMVWTMSRWSREILEANGVPAARIRIVPAGVDTQRFVPSPLKTDHSPFRFLSVGKWEERKGSAGLVRAFAEEFDPAEPVELILHCATSWPRKRDFRREIANELAAAGRSHARITISEPVGESGFVELMQRSDAFVLATRAEAWGLPILEAMACQLPCIVTGYSGLREYANDENCFLVRVEAMIKAHDPEFYPTNYDWGQWAEPDWKHLRSLMRHVYENREDAMAKARRAREDAERYWTWDLAARKALTHIEELRSGAVGRGA